MAYHHSFYETVSYDLLYSEYKIIDSIYIDSFYICYNPFNIDYNHIRSSSSLSLDLTIL